MSSEQINLSIIITSLNDLNSFRILKDLSEANYNGLLFEFLFLEAGENIENEVRKILKPHEQKLKYFHNPNLNRTASLNFLINESKGEYISRLDSRTHIYPNYFLDLYNKSKMLDVQNIGGVKKPIGETKKQKFIASIMSSKFCFGGVKFRNLNFSGFVKTVYLGFFQSEFLKKKKLKFDESQPKISEDSDLNFQIIKNGGKIYCDSSILVEYYSRDSISSFLKMIYNYGFGRGLFFQKNRFIEIRQVIPPMLFLSIIFLILFSFFTAISAKLLFILLFFYGLVNTYFVLKLNFKLKQSINAFILFFLTHLIWSFGFFCSFKTFYFLGKK